MDGSSDSRYVTAPTTLAEYATTSASPLSDPAPSGSSMERNVSVEEGIERSKSLWSEVVKSDPSITDDQEMADNVEVFKELQSHPTWGEFFITFGYGLGTPVPRRPGFVHGSAGELVMGEKFAEGGQAELFHAQVIWRHPKDNEDDLKRGKEWVLKVFKKGTSLRHLQSQWPHGYLQYKGESYSNPNYPDFIRYFCDVTFGILLKDGRFAFLMEKEHEDLRHIIDRKMLEIGQEQGPFSKDDGELNMYKIARGMDWLHERNIVHRDLKAPNVLCSEFENGYKVYVSDYECSIGVIGTGFWRAPEILQAIKDKKVFQRMEVFSKEADVYAYGMTCYEILTGKHPFEGHSLRDYDLVLNGQRPKLPAYIDDWIVELVNRCWEHNPLERPSFVEILDLFISKSVKVRDFIESERKFLENL